MQYALEGSVFIAGAAIQWLRDELKIIENTAEVEALATSLQDNEGVYLVPAFVGLGAPYWNMDARGALIGLTRGTNRSHLARAALEAIAYQTKDVLVAMSNDAHLNLKALRVDGGATTNNFLMQFQADILQIPVERPVITETTALGAAYLAGLAVGYWGSQADILQNWQLNKTFQPHLAPQKSESLYQGWLQAVKSIL